MIALCSLRSDKIKQRGRTREADHPLSLGKAPLSPLQREAKVKGPVGNNKLYIINSLTIYSVFFLSLFGHFESLLFVLQLFVVVVHLFTAILSLCSLFVSCVSL